MNYINIHDYEKNIPKLIGYFAFFFVGSTNLLFYYLLNYNINHLIIFFITYNLFVILTMIFFYKKIKNVLNNLFDLLKLNINLKFKQESDTLESKIIQDIAENIHHELKSPILSVKNIIMEYHYILNLLKSLARQDGKRAIDRIYYQKPKNCLLCSNFGSEGIPCKYYNRYDKPLTDLLVELQNISKISIKNMYNTIEITKGFKSIKNINEEVNVYDTIEQAVLIYNMIQKYKFKFNIDQKLKKCYLNGLNPDILINILLNHIKNSLEANASLITFKFIKQEIKNINNKEKTFIIFEIIDNGIGIPKDKFDKIYEFEYSTKEENINKLRGVGLYISREVLRYYRGDEKLKSTSSNGTIFEINIPVKYCEKDI